MKRIEYQPGQKINNVIFIKEVAPHIDFKSKNKFRKALFQCPYCGAEFEAQISDVKKAQFTSLETPDTRKTSEKQPLTLSDIGITHNESSTSKKVASLSEKE